MLENVVMKSDSPVSTRLPAEQDFVEEALAAAGSGSPKTVSILMPAVMYIMAPASAMTISPGSSVTSANCISLPKIS